ncbi:hypothetical protein E4U23_004264 [Claviceps purpurea]|nr:hypothetical protein E4U23_004264 [Claviceps purpurea]
MYYLLRGADGYSSWQRAYVTEVWHYYAGAPLVMVMVQNLENGSSNSMISVLGPDLFSKPEQLPQIPRRASHKTGLCLESWESQVANPSYMIAIIDGSTSTVRGGVVLVRFLELTR